MLFRSMTELEKDIRAFGKECNIGAAALDAEYPEGRGVKEPLKTGGKQARREFRIKMIKRMNEIIEKHQITWDEYYEESQKIDADVK